MKKNIFLTICVMGLLIIFASHSFSYDDPRKIDGYEWKKFPLELKLGFVLGWGDCAKAFNDAVALAMLHAKNETHLKFYRKYWAHVEKSDKTAFELYKSAYEQYETSFKEKFMKRKGINIGFATVGQIIDMIDKIYEDVRVKNWKVTYVMPLVFGRLKGGWTEKDLDEAIAWKIKERELSGKFERKEIDEIECLKLIQKLELEKPKALKEFD